MSDKSLSRELRRKKDGLYPVIKVRVHTLTVGNNEIHNVVSLDRVSPSKTCKEASFSNTTPSLPQSDEGLHTDVCPPPHSAFSREAIEYVVRKLVDDG